MFAAECHEELAAADHLVGDAFDLVDERLHLAERQFHFRQREYPDAVDIHLHLFVPQFHVRGGLQDFARTVAGAANVRRGAIDGNGQNHYFRIVERTPMGQRAAEHQRSAMVVLKRKLHYVGASKRASGNGRPSTAITGPERSKPRHFRLARVSRELVASAVTSSGSATVASACTVTCSASVASLPQLCASSRLAPRRSAEVRDVGHDLQRVAMTADTLVVELRLHARLVDEILGCAAAEHDRGRARMTDHEICGLDDVADHVDQAGGGIAMPRL